MANALLGMASVINDPREDFNVSADRLDAMQRLCHGAFDGKLNNCFGSKVLLCLCYKRVLKLAFEDRVSTLPIFAIVVFSLSVARPNGCIDCVSLLARLSAASGQHYAKLQRTHRNQKKASTQHRQETV